MLSINENLSLPLSPSEEAGKLFPVLNIVPLPPSFSSLPLISIPVKACNAFSMINTLLVFLRSYLTGKDEAH